jgi:SAM-dependent methyltransferase
MNSRWLDVPLADYEGYMALPGIEQAQLLSDIFAGVLAKFSPRSVAVIGCAGGNGFDRIPSAISRVVVVDLNPRFVAVTKARFGDRIENLELMVGDIQDHEVLFAPVDLIFLGLILEYVNVESVVARMPPMLTARGHMVTVLQLPTVDLQQVSPSPFTSVHPVGEVMDLVPPARLRESVEAHGYIQLESRNVVSRGGKPFQVQAFGMSPNLEVNTDAARYGGAAPVTSTLAGRRGRARSPCMPRFPFEARPTPTRPQSVT